MPVVDFHTHVFPPWLRERRDEFLSRDRTFGLLYASPKARMATAEELVASMEVSDIDASVMAGIGWTDPDLARRCNDYLLESAARFPDRLIAFCGASPAWGEGAASEAERCARGGARGIGELHPDTQCFPLDSKEAMSPLMDSARALGLIVMTHTSEPVGHVYVGKGTATPGRTLALCQAFPQNTIVLAHWGGGLPFYALMPEVAESLGNAYFDTAASPFLYGPRVFRLGTELAGSGRVLFATDYPLLGQARVLRQLRDAGLPPEAEVAVAGGNAARLLGLKAD